MATVGSYGSDFILYRIIGTLHRISKIFVQNAIRKPVELCGEEISGDSDTNHFQMKILLYSYVFSPKLGGVETVSEMLGRGFIEIGEECKLITETEADSKTTYFPFEVIRNPKASDRKALVEWADIILFNGASLALQPWVLIKKKPFIWIHVGYQASCIDGLGWVDGIRAPIKPWASINFHRKRSGLLFALKEGLKLFVRNFFAKSLVDHNIAITQWMYECQPFSKQKIIYNPFPLEKFRLPSKNIECVYDFVFVGRLVSEKGLPVLLKALAELRDISGKEYKLLIIGDGDCREKYQKLAVELAVNHLVYFAGKKSGQELVDAIYQAPIAIVPSEWYEPMGGVALELLAAGRNVIVSEEGGLKECVGEAGLSFPNGDHTILAEKMILLKENKDLQENLKTNAIQVLDKFIAEKIIRQYQQFLSGILKEHQK